VTPDPPLPPGAKAYLAEFDRYLRAETHTERVEARAGMRAKLDVMLAVNEDAIDVDLTDVPSQWGTGRRRFRRAA
jgi:hypothetical protein